MSTSHNTSTQQRRAAAYLPQALRRMSALPLPLGGYEARDVGVGGFSDWETPRPLVNATRVSIVRVMRELDRAATAEEIREQLDDDTLLEIVEYHLSALAAIRIVKLVLRRGRDIRYRLLSEDEEAESF